MAEFRRWVFVAGGCLFLLLAGGCSSGEETVEATPSDDSSGATIAVEPAVDVQPDAGDDPNSDSAAVGVSCDEMIEPSGLYRGAAGWLPQIVDAESEDLLAGDYDQVLEAIEAMRPIQDIEGLFGSTRQGFDNMEADLAAAKDGQFDNKVGDYGVPTLNAVIAEEVCG